MTLKRHPDPAVQALLREVQDAGWRFEVASGRAAHPFGRLLCPGGHCGPIWVMSTPRGDSQVKVLRRMIKRCPHQAPISGQE